MRHNVAYLLASVERYDFHGVVAMGFLKNFVVLKCLFAYVDIWKSYRLEKKNHVADKNLFEERSVFTEKFLSMASTLFSHFFQFAVFAVFCSFCSRKLLRELINF